MDNAIVNARILERMSFAWQKAFLTLGVLIAVLGMRLIFPLLIVGVSAQIDPISALKLALEKGNPNTVGTYGYILHHAHPQIAAFGGMFLLMLALGFSLMSGHILGLKYQRKSFKKLEIFRQQMQLFPLFCF